MPEIKPCPFDLFVKFLLRDQILFFQDRHDRLAWLGELLVVVDHEVVVLFIERIHVVFSMAVDADILHSNTLVLP